MYLLEVVRVESIWAMATSRLGFSYNASQFLPEIFRTMFPDSQIAADDSLRSRKLSYVVSHGTGFYFTSELIKDVGKAHGFTLIFDETTIPGVRKQLDIFFRYWSETINCICVRFYKSIMLGHATANIISRSIIDSLKSDGIDVSKTLMLGMSYLLLFLVWYVSIFIGRNNPNVNKAVEDMINKEVISERKKKWKLLLLLSSSEFLNFLLGHRLCRYRVSFLLAHAHLHIIHGAFRKGFKSTVWFIDESINDIWF